MKRAVKRASSSRPISRPVRAPGTVSIRALLHVLTPDELAARSGVHVTTVRRWRARGAPSARKASLSSVILTERERIAAETKKIARVARKEGRISRPGDAPGFNERSKQETRRYKGVVENTRFRRGMLVSERSEEEIVHAIMQKARKVQRRSKKGRFFVTLGLVEFGGLEGSGGKQLLEVTRGRFGGLSAYQTFASTSPDYGQRRVRGARDLAGLESQIRTLIGRLHDNPRRAAVIDNFTVKRYRQKSEKEIGSWRKNRGK